MQKTVTYFEKPGRDNTVACLDISKKAIEDEGYNHIVVASTAGGTGLLFSEALKASPVNVVIVTHSSGFKEPNTHEMPDAVKKNIEAHGAKVFTGSMLTPSIETSFATKFSGLYPTLIVANSLRRFGEGAKVCCEIVMMAVDAGLIPEGADAVMVIKSAASKRFLELRVLEILAKPRV